MSIIPPTAASPGHPEELKAPLEVFGLDGKIYKLAVFLRIPKTPATPNAPRYVSVRIEDKDAFVEITELARRLGIATSEINGKRPENVAGLINRHNRLVFMSRELLSSSIEGSKLGTEDTTNVIRFIATYLNGREDHRKALPQVRFALEKVERLQALVYAAKEPGPEYIGKEDASQSIFLSQGEIYYGGVELGKGAGTKVSSLESTSSIMSAKAVAKGSKAVASLDKHLKIAELLNNLGVPYITPTHRMKLLTETKSGDEKLVALVSKLDGDGKKLRDLGVSPIHVGQVLFQCAQALACMHANRYVHSDVKPANILLRGDITQEPEILKDGRLKAVEGVLHDFGGTAKMGFDINTITLMYVAPEVMNKDATILVPSQDAFSFGVTICEMASTLRLLSDQDKLFAEASSDAEIAQRFKEIKLRILSTPQIDPPDQLLRIRLLEVAEKLVRINPLDRLSLADTAALLGSVLTVHLDDIDQGRVFPKLEATGKQLGFI